MTNNSTTVLSTNYEYGKSAFPLKKVRACNKGSDTVKQAEKIFLPHPSDGDTTTEFAKKRYDRYKAGAEFNGYTGETRRTMIGKMRIIDTAIELPDKIKYLIEDADGDGTSLKGAIELQINEIMQTKWALWVVDYNGLGQVDTDSLSKADVKVLKPRSVIKQYTRESLVDWAFDRINGVMQLVFADFVEFSEKFNHDTKKTETIESHLYLGLDDIGYYQQKVVDGDEGEKDYVTVNGESLKWMPVIIVADEQLKAGQLPIEVGFLGQIADIDLHMYNKSAIYTETQRCLAPTTYTRGWQEGDKELFKEINGGRENIETGAYSVNNMPKEIQVELVGINAELGSFQWDFEQAEKRVIALGGSTASSGGAMTATEADINASKQNAMLSQYADNSEAAIKRACSYCAMFEGLWLPADVEKNLDKIRIELPRDFATPKLSIEEVEALRALRLEGQLTSKQLTTALYNGGWGVGESLEEMIAEIDGMGGALPPSRTADVVEEAVGEEEPPE